MEKPELLACLLLATGMTLATLPARAQTEPVEFVDDTTVLARVDDRAITVGDFRLRYFGVSAQYRSTPDSAGRAHFLGTLIDKDVLGLEARALGVPLNFEDRTALRSHEQLTLINTLYTRAIDDSTIAAAEDYARYRPQFSRELHLRRIAFPDPPSAEQARNDLLKKKITWRQAVERSGIADLGPEGDAGWRNRTEYSSELALRIFDLKLNEISTVVTDHVAYYLFQAIEERSVAPPPPSSIRFIIKMDVARAKRRKLADRLFAAIRSRAQVAYDTTEIVRVVRRFYDEVQPPKVAPGRMALDFRGRMPEFDATDRERILARMLGRTFTVADFEAGYKAIPPALRPSVRAFDPMFQTIERMLLEPELAEEARARGLEKDPLYIAEVEKKREALMVEHLFQDSIAVRVRVTPAARKAYYERNRGQFASVAKVRYARFIRQGQTSADSLLVVLRSGVSAESLVAQDKAQGLTSMIREVTDYEQLEYRKILMEELKPGRGTSIGPDAEGNVLILFALDYTAPRELSLEEVAEVVDESIQNLESERRLHDYLDRIRPHHRIVSQTALVARINLTDPAMDR